MVLSIAIVTLKTDGKCCSGKYKKSPKYAVNAFEGEESHE